MIEGWMLLAFFIASPLVFVVGFTAAMYQVRRLAREGGETNYSDRVTEAVRAYREEHPHPNHLTGDSIEARAGDRGGDQ